MSPGPREPDRNRGPADETTPATPRGDGRLDDATAPAGGPPHDPQPRRPDDLGEAVEAVDEAPLASGAAGGLGDPGSSGEARDPAEAGGPVDSGGPVDPGGCDVAGGPVDSGGRDVASGPVDPGGPDEAGSSGEAGTADEAGDDASSALRAERDAHLMDLQRVTAEFANFRRQTAKRHGELVEQAASRLASALLPVLDACEAACGQGVEGIEAIRSQLLNVLTNEGLATLGTVGDPFDPSRHEAVIAEQSDQADSADPVVSEVLRTGYEWKGRVLRAAMVRVRR